MMKYSKGQAALEFLTTYGWMFMIIIVVFSALAYFGFTDVRENIPDSCRFDAAFDCVAYISYEDGSYAFEITNVDGRRINLINVVCAYTFTDEQVRYNYSVATIFDPGDSRTYLCDSSDVGGAPTGYSGKHLHQTQIVYTYVEDDPFPKVASGELITTVTDDAVLWSDYTSSDENPTFTLPFFP